MTVRYGGNVWNALPPPVAPESKAALLAVDPLAAPELNAAELAVEPEAAPVLAEVVLVVWVCPEPALPGADLPPYVFPAWKFVSKVTPVNLSVLHTLPCTCSGPKAVEPVPLGVE